MMNIANKKQ